MMARSIFITSAVLAGLGLLSTSAFATQKEPVKTVKPAKVAAAKPATPQARPGLFAPDTGVDTTATVSSAPPSLRHGCGTMACKNYTLMGVGF